MISIPALSENDLGDTIEGEFGIPVILKSPGGVAIDMDANGSPLRGFVRRSYKDTRERRGETDVTVVNAPCVKLRLSSLSEIPETGADWIIGIPSGPQQGSGTDWYNLDPKKAVEVNKDKGTVKLFLAKMQGGAA